MIFHDCMIEFRKDFEALPWWMRKSLVRHGKSRIEAYFVYLETHFTLKAPVKDSALISNGM